MRKMVGGGALVRKLILTYALCGAHIPMKTEHHTFTVSHREWPCVGIASCYPVRTCPADNHLGVGIVVKQAKPLFISNPCRERFPCGTVPSLHTIRG